MSDLNKLTVINTLKGLDNLTPEIIKSEDFNNKYELLISTIDQLTKIKDDLTAEMKKTLKDQYFKTGEGSVKTNKYSFSYFPATTRETIDSKSLKAEQPLIYKKYVKISNISETFKAIPIKEKVSDDEHVEKMFDTLVKDLIKEEKDLIDLK